MTTRTARREGARTAPPKQAFETRVERRHPACAAISSRKRSPLAQKSAAKTSGGKRNRFSEQTRGIQKPTSGKPLHIDCVLEPRKTGACGAEARMHGLGTLTRGTQRILATSPLRRGLSPQRKPPRRQRGPEADDARRSEGSRHAPRQNNPRPMGKARGGNRVPGKGTRNAAHENRPGPMEPGADIAAYWRERDRQHTAIDRAPLGAKRMHKGRLPFGMVTSRSGPASHPDRAWRPPAW